MIKINMLFLLLFGFGFVARGQQYNQIPEFIGANNIWTYSEYKGIDFSNGTPGLPIVTNSTGTDAGASVCDPLTGNLLFYTDGEKCYDANGQVMPNGANIVAGIGPQSVRIVPFINDVSKYYMFTIMGYGAGSQVGLRYSVVDMNLNGGLGDVVSTQKNIIIPQDSDQDSDTLTTALMAIPGDNCDVWLITHTFAGSVFKAYHITASGLDPVPVVSTAGHLNASGVPVVFAIFGYISGSYFRSLMAVSPDRHYIGISSADIIAATVNMATADMNGYLLCRFDPLTGVVSDPIEIENDVLSLGSAFSPDGSKLYLYDPSPGLTAGAPVLKQYSLANYDSLAIASSMQVIDTFETLYAHFQLFRDTIFVRADQLDGVSTINHPNLSGSACDFQLASLTPSADLHAGLHPEVVYSFPDTSRLLMMDTLVCDWTNAVSLTPRFSADDYVYTWSTGASDSALSISSAGIYWVVYGNDCHSRVDTFRVHGSQLDTPSITVNLFELGTTASYFSYQWMLDGNMIPGATNPICDVNQNGNYQVIVSDEYGCTATSGIYEVNNYTGIEDWFGSPSIKVYPNPSDDLVFVNAPVLVNLTVTAIDGRTVKRLENGKQISIADLAEGVYFLKIEDRKGRLLKVVKCVKAKSL